MKWILVTESTKFPLENYFLVKIKEDSFLEGGLFYCCWEPIGKFSLYPILPSTCCSKDYLKLCAGCSKSRWISSEELNAISDFYLSIPNHPERSKQEDSFH